MPLPNHINPDQFLDLEQAQKVTKEDVAAAWELSYERLAHRLQGLGEAATLYVVFGLQGAGKTTWVKHNAPLLGEQSVFLDGPLPSRRHRKRALGIAAEAGCRVVAVWVNTPLEVAKLQNANRVGLARIREEAIMHVFERLEPPSLEEGFSEVIEVLPHSPPPNPSVERTVNGGAPSCLFPSAVPPLSAAHVKR